ncbi:MAG: hypothetical protein ACP5IO_03815 [Elusimicrobiales bacterium]
MKKRKMNRNRKLSKKTKEEVNYSLENILEIYGRKAPKIKPPF